MFSVLLGGLNGIHSRTSGYLRSKAMKGWLGLAVVCALVLVLAWFGWNSYNGHTMQAAEPDVADAAADGALRASIVATPTPLTAQAGNITATTIYTTPAANHYYQVCMELSVTQAAATSSTAPQPQLDYTSAIDGVIKVANIGFSTGLTGNATYLSNIGCAVIYAKASTNIQLATVNYASVGTKPMQYSLSGTVQLIQ
jgi:hypothetical protein